MATDSFDDDRPGIFRRLRGLLLHPQAAWERIAREAPEPSPLKTYVTPLAFLGGVAAVAAHFIYRGFEVDGDLVWRAVSAALYVVFAVIGVALAGGLIGWLAPRFGAEVHDGRAGLLATYAATPILVSALGVLAPPTAGLIVLAGVVYALIELAVGVKVLAPMRTHDSVPRFVLLFAAVAFAAFALLGMVLAPLLGVGRQRLADLFEVTASAPAPREARASLVARTLEAVAQSSRARAAVDPARLEEQFPGSLPGGYALFSTSGERAETLSRARAVYQEGDARLRVTLLQLTPAIDVQALAGELAINEGVAPEGGYARTEVVDGRLFAEEARGDGSSRYVVIGRGVAIIAEGAVTVDEARAAVETLSVRRLEGLFSN